MRPLLTLILAIGWTAVSAALIFAVEDYKSR